MSKTPAELAALDRPALEAAYLATVPEDLRAASASGIATYPTSYLIARLSPAPKTRGRRGPRIARHANDEGHS